MDECTHERVDVQGNRCVVKAERCRIVLNGNSEFRDARDISRIYARDAPLTKVYERGLRRICLTWEIISHANATWLRLVKIVC